MRLMELASEMGINPTELIALAKKNKISDLQPGTMLSTQDIALLRATVQPKHPAGLLKKKAAVKKPAKAKSTKEVAATDEKNKDQKVTKEAKPKLKKKPATTSKPKATKQKDPAVIEATTKPKDSQKIEAATKIEATTESSAKNTETKPISIPQPAPEAKSVVDSDDITTTKTDPAASKPKSKPASSEPPTKDTKTIEDTVKPKKAKAKKTAFEFIRKAPRVKEDDDLEFSKIKPKKTAFVSYKFDKDAAEGNKFTPNTSKLHAKNTYKRGKKGAYNKSAATANIKPEIIERKKELVIPKTITVSDLSNISGIRAGELIKKLMMLGVMATINQMIDAETAQLICSEFDVDIKIDDYDPEQLLIRKPNPDEIKPRPPVVTIMGHVDHGKTSLLDTIRKANVVDAEAGGITQHIGAYFVKTKDGGISFLDTPGHEAFTEMRARGAVATDIVILVVAADDGPKPQTIEAINHAKAAAVPVLVAINKCDKPNADPERTKQQLLNAGLVAESLGGDVTMVNISAKQGSGIEELLSLVVLQSQTMDLKAETKGFATGIVVESRLDKVRGNVVCLLVQAGCLKVGDVIIAGTNVGKIKAMHDPQGNKLNEALPSFAAEILGFNDLPQAGEKFWVVDGEKTARIIQEARKNKANAKVLKNSAPMKMENIFEQIKAEKKLTLNLILKTDVNGSLEAIQTSLAKWNSDKIQIRYLHAAVGAISSSDVTLAAASNAIIIGFNVRPDNKASALCKQTNVQIKLYNIIYNLFDDIKNSLEGMIEPITYEEELGKAEILNIFKMPKIGLIAGCKITEGKITSDSLIRVVRDNVVVNKSKIKTLKRFKDDAKEVVAGFECGILLDANKDVKVGDILEAYFEVQKKQQL